MSGDARPGTDKRGASGERYRFRLACRHWSPIVEPEHAAKIRALGRMPCYKEGHPRGVFDVVKERMVRDTASTNWQQAYKR